MNQEKRKGFTLIELLVAIAIISILAAVLFPVFAQARAKARQTQCTSNLRQMGSAMQQYTEDYDEKVPLTYTASYAPLDCYSGTTADCALKYSWPQ